MMGVTFILIGCLMDFGSKSIGGSAASLDDGVYEVDKPAFQVSLDVNIGFENS